MLISSTTRAGLLVSIGVLAGLALGAGCGGGGDKNIALTNDGGGDDGAVESGADATAPTATLRIDPAEIDLTTTLGGATASSATVHVYETPAPGAPEVDVTSSVSLSVGSDLASVTGATVTAGSHGGIGTLSASLAGATSASAKLVVKLTGAVVPTGVDPTTPTKFAGAKVDPTTTSQPSIEYPLDGAVVPSNVPPMEVQWTVGGDSTVYRAHFTQASVLDVYVYSSSREALPDAATWKTLTATLAGSGADITVEGLGASGIHASTAVHLNVATDAIDDSTIYYWESSSGSLKALEFATGNLAPLPVTGSAYAPGSPGVCVACHTVSRDGTRFSYTSGAFQLGTLKASADKKSFAASIEPGTKLTPGFKWTYGAFNPLESTTTPALLVTKADTTAGQNVAGHVRLALVDPDTGADVPSNLTDWLTAMPSGMPLDQLQPDWSPGGFIVYSAYDSERANPSGSPAKAWVRDLGDDAVASSIIEAPIKWDATKKAFTFGTPQVLVTPPASASLDTWETDVLPQISPDDSLVVFTRSVGWWPIRFQTDPVNGSGKLAVVRRSDKAVIELAAANSKVETNSTWPQWAPTIGSTYAWVAYSAERPYGHRMAPGVALPPACIPQGRSLCKNMWITAIDLKKAASGTADPSAVPFWLPGQTALASAVSPRWTKTGVKVK